MKLYDLSGHIMCCSMQCSNTLQCNIKAKMCNDADSTFIFLFFSFEWNGLCWISDIHLMFYDQKTLRNIHSDICCGCFDMFTWLTLRKGPIVVESEKKKYAFIRKMCNCGTFHKAFSRMSIYLTCEYRNSMHFAQRILWYSGKRIAFSHELRLNK